MTVTIKKVIEAEKAAFAIRKMHVYAIRAGYHSSDDSIRVTLNNGVVLMIPADGHLYSGKKNKPDDHKLDHIEISPTGLGLYWPDIGETFYVPCLYTGAIWKHHFHDGSPWPQNKEDGRPEAEAA